jgi:WD40 repeat protein
MSFKSDGSQITTISKDNFLRIFDTRSLKLVGETPAHQGIKPSRVTWLGSSDYIFTVGFSKSRDREYSLYDIRMLSRPTVLKKLDTSTGVLTPLVSA